MSDPVTTSGVDLDAPLADIIYTDLTAIFCESMQDTLHFVRSRRIVPTEDRLQREAYASVDHCWTEGAIHDRRVM